MEKSKVEQLKEEMKDPTSKWAQRAKKVMESAKELRPVPEKK